MSVKHSASVIVAARNARTTIRECLRSLAAQDVNSPFEVIVVDSSTDGTPVIIEHEFPRVRLIHREGRLLPGRARNIGVERSSGEVIAFLPADCFAPPEWLSARLRRHAQGHKVVASSIENGNPGRLLGWAEFLTAYSRQMHSPNERPALVENRGLLFLSYTRDIFERFGPYPEDRFGCEDSVFVSRILNGRLSILYDPAIRFYHLNQASALGFLAHRARHGIDAGSAARTSPLRDADYPLKLLLPLYFPPAKLGLILFRILKKKPGSLAPFLPVSPLIAAGLFAFAAGYWRGYSRSGR